MKRNLRLLLLSVVLASPLSVSAADPIVPMHALSSDQYNILASYKQYSEGTVPGAGSAIAITYSSSVPLNGYVAILDANGSYNPADLYHFTMDAAQNETVTLDVTALTTWTPSYHTYYLNFLSNADITDTQFHNMAVVPASFIHILKASVRHPFLMEPYWVSSSHLLRGYRSLSTPLPLLLAIAGIVAAVVIVFVRKKNLVAPMFILLAVVTSLYMIRVSADLAIHTVKHIAEWTAAHAYGEAHDMYSVADALKEKRNDLTNVAVCFDSTDYYAKLLRYFLYPTPVSLTKTADEHTTHVVVTHALNWTFEGRALTCGDITVQATQLESFPDGTVLFSVP